MKTGYSLLLGDYVPATEANHCDTADFQIVCPCCKDPVFKVERHQADTASEFFSHFTSKPENAECELRVRSLTMDQIRREASLSRGQSLKAFQSVIRDAIELTWGDDHLPPERSVQSLQDLPGVQAFLTWFPASYARGAWDEILPDSLNDYVDRMHALNNVHGHYSHMFQKRVTMDILDHVKAPSMERTRKHLALHGLRRMLQLGDYFEDNDPSSFQAILIRDVRKLMLAPASQYSHERMMRLWKTPLPKPANADADMEEWDHTYLSLFSQMALNKIVCSLARIPYRKLLANKNDSRYLLDGVIALEPYSSLEPLPATSLPGR